MMSKNFLLCLSQTHLTLYVGIFLHAFQKLYKMIPWSNDGGYQTHDTRCIGGVMVSCFLNVSTMVAPDENHK